MSESDAPVVLRLDGVSRTFSPFPNWLRAVVRTPVTEPVRALKDASLELRAGEQLAVVGPNGAGKTTMFRNIVGLDEPTAGTVHVCGEDVQAAGRRARAMVGWVPAEGRGIFLRQTCFENLWFAGRMQGIGRQALGPRIDEVMEAVGIAHALHRAASALSTGMRARLQLARAMLHRPRLLVLDEPTGAIDPVAAYELLQILQRLAVDQGVGLLISSHRLEEIEALGSRVVLLDQGSLIFDGSLARLGVGEARDRIVLTYRDSTAAAAAARGMGTHGISAHTADALVTAEFSAFEPVGRLLGLPSVSDGLVDVARAHAKLRDVIAAVYADRRAP